MPLPAEGFDPTETGVPFRALATAGHRVVVATPLGAVAHADPRMVTGAGLRVFAPFLRADQTGHTAYEQMVSSSVFRAPISYNQMREQPYDALLLPGGHAKGMRPYLEDKRVQALVVDAFAHNRVVGAICHGVLVVARSVDAKTGHSVLYGRRTTALLRSQELLAWNLTRLWLKDYYRTYPETVEDEVKGFLREPSDFLAGPLPWRRDDPAHPARGFVHRDGRYLSARWPGDAHAFAAALIEMLDDG